MGRQRTDSESAAASTAAGFGFNGSVQQTSVFTSSTARYWEDEAPANGAVLPEPLPRPASMRSRRSPQPSADYDEEAPEHEREELLIRRSQSLTLPDGDLERYAAGEGDGRESPVHLGNGTGAKAGAGATLHRTRSWNFFKKKGAATPKNPSPIEEAAAAEAAASLANSLDGEGPPGWSRGRGQNGTEAGEQLPGHSAASGAAQQSSGAGGALKRSRLRPGSAPPLCVSERGPMPAAQPLEIDSTVWAAVDGTGSKNIFRRSHTNGTETAKAPLYSKLDSGSSRFGGLFNGRRGGRPASGKAAKPVEPDRGVCQPCVEHPAVHTSSLLCRSTSFRCIRKAVHSLKAEAGSGRKPRPAYCCDAGDSTSSRSSLDGSLQDNASCPEDGVLLKFSHWMAQQPYDILECEQ